MNSQQKEAANGSTTSRGSNIPRRENKTALHNKGQTNHETKQSKGKQTNTSQHKSFSPTGDQRRGTDMPPVEENVLQRDDRRFKRGNPSVQQKDTKSHVGHLSNSKGRVTDIKLAAADTVRDSHATDKNKSSEKASETAKEKHQTKGKGVQRLNRPIKPPELSQESVALSDSEPRSTASKIKRFSRPTKHPQQSVHNSDSNSEPHPTEFRSLNQQRFRNERFNERNAGKQGHRNTNPLGHDRTLHQHFIKDMYFNMKSVGNIKFDNKVLGTGFRVGSHYLMTAWQVIHFIINPYMSAGVSGYNWSRLKNAAVCVDFDEDGGSSFSLTGQYIFSNIKLDVAVVEIDRQGRKLPPPLKLSKKDTSSIRDVYFIGYGHQSDSRKRVDPFCEVLDKHDPRIQAAKEDIFNKLDLRAIVRLRGLYPGLLVKRYADIDLNFRFAVQCALEQGASGAPAVSESDGSVVGILVSGVPHFYYKPFMKNDQEDVAKIQRFPNKYRFELCTKISSIYENMKHRRLELAEEIFSHRLR